MTMAPADVDIAAKSFWEEPEDVREDAFRKLRKETPVFWSRPAESDLLPDEMNTRGFWSLTKYLDIQYASRNPQIFSSADGVIMEDFPREVTEMAQSFIAMDAPRHTQLRGITLEAFKPGNLRKIEDNIRKHVHDLIAEVAPLGGGDFVDLVASQVPGRVFGSFFGFTPGDEQHNRAMHAAGRMLAWTDPEVRGDLTALELFQSAAQEMHNLAAEIVPERRKDPKDDLVTWIAEAEFEGQHMTDFEIGGLFVLIGIAAIDTTRHASAGGMLALTQNPDQRALLLEDLPGRAESAVEEIVRWVTPVIHMRRTTTQDVEVGGQKIKAGEKVVLWYNSGNRDEDHWTNPYDFDILRKPNRHQGFGGGGAHYCMGAYLARLMVKSMLLEVYAQIPDIEVGDPDMLVANFIHGIKTLPATWTPPAS